MNINQKDFLNILEEHNRLDFQKQIDYNKYYLYSIITHSTAIEGSTMTEVDNQLLFDEGLTAKGKNIIEHNMNLDLKQLTRGVWNWQKDIRLSLLEYLNSWLRLL